MSRDHTDGTLADAKTIDLRDLRGSICSRVRGVTLADMNAAIRSGATNTSADRRRHQRFTRP